MSKKVKKVLIAALCLMLTACVALFAACNDDCEHEYGEWSVTKAATCAEKGVKTRVCSKCEYIDAEEIAATGEHSYGEWQITTPAECEKAGEQTRVCSVCKAEEKQEIAATGHSGTIKCANCDKVFVEKSFTEAFYKSFGTVDKNKGIELTVGKFEVNSPTEGGGTVKIKVNGGKAFLGTDENGELFAYGKITATATTAGVVTESEATFVIKGDDLYAAVVAKADVADPDYEDKEEYYAFSISETLGAYVDGTFSEIAEETDETTAIIAMIIAKIPEVVEFVKNDVAPFVGGITATYQDEIHAATAMALSVLFDVSEKDGNYVLTSKEQPITDVINDLDTLTAEKFIKKYFGSNALTIIENAPALLDKTVGEVLTYLGEHGVTVNSVVALLDKAVQVITDDENATFESFTEVDLKTEIESVKDKTLLEVINEATGSSLDKNTVSTYITGLLTKAKTKTIYQMVETSETEIAEEKTAAAMLDSLLSAKYVFAKEGSSAGKFTLDVNLAILAATDQGITVPAGEKVQIVVNFGVTPDADGAGIDVEDFIALVSEKTTPTPTISYTVDYNQWNQAFDSLKHLSTGSSLNVRVTESYNTTSSYTTYTNTAEIDGNLYYRHHINGTGTEESEYYEDFSGISSGSEGIKYEKNTSGEWVATGLGLVAGTSVNVRVPTSLDNFTNYKYDQATQTYVYNNATYANRYKNVSVKFKNGKIIELSYWEKDSGATTTYTFEYDNVTIELPEVNNAQAA